MKNLKDKTVLITGAASGIGRALAHKFNQIGAKIVIVDINENDLKETQSICKFKENCFEYIMDVSQHENWQTLHKFLGEKKLIPDIVINNAGRAMSHVSINDVAIEDFEKIMKTNFWGVFWGTKEFLPDLLAKESQTAIINVSSAFGLMACGWASPYTTSKFAVRGFTEALRQELRGTNILVSCVHPCGVKTGIAKNAHIAKNVEITEEMITKAKEFEAKSQTTAEQAAEIILEGISKNKKRILVGQDAKLIDLIARLKPVSYDDFMFKHVLKK